MRTHGVVLVALAGSLLGSACSPDDGEGSYAADAEEVVVAREPVAEGVALAASARGFPTLRSLDGEVLAHGHFAQWLEGDRLHLRVGYRFPDGRRIDEEAVVRLAPGPVQEHWSWSETRDDQTLRRFEVDFEAATATAETHADGDVSRWSEEIDAEPGRTFAGFGFTLLLKSLRERLVAGEAVESEVVIFRPEPRVVTVELSHGGVEQMQVSGRTLRGDRFDIEPQIPWLIGLFVEAPTTRIWLTHPPPAEFLRWEGPLVGPDDPVIRVDGIPGEGSGPAEPVPAGSP